MCPSRKPLGFALLFVMMAALDIPAQERPAFRAGVQVVEVDARVFDREGRFMTDLTHEDFELLEGGVAQQVQAVYLVANGEPPVLRAGARTAAAPAGDPERVGTPRQTWIFVFDLNHLTPGAGFDRARAAVEHYVRDRFRDGDLAGVVAGSRMVNNRLTSVREELIAAVASVKPLADSRSRQIDLTGEWPRLLDEREAILIANEDRLALQSAVTRACTDQPGWCYPEAGRAVASYIPPDDEIRQKARRLQRDIQRATLETLNAVNGLSSGLAKIPGSKTIVFLSDGFVVEEMETTLRSAVGQVARAGARVYAVDVRGLSRGIGATVDRAQPSDSGAAAARFDMHEDGPNSLATDTGGLMIRNENNLGRALDTIAGDANRYYVLAYQPANAAFDGTYRPIEVRVKRPGVRVRARRGYLAIEPSRMLVPRAITETDTARTEARPADPDVSTPADTDAAGREPAANVSSGTVVTTPSAPVTGGVRLRPDADERIAQLSRGEIASASALAREGWEAYQRGDVEAAIAPLSGAAAHADAHPWVLYTLGLSQLALGRAEAAIASWERVRRAAPDFEPVYIDLADTYVRLSEETKALAVLRDAEARWPSEAEIHNAVGVIHVRRGALDEAVAAFSRAAASAPQEPLAYFNLGRAYELRFARGQRYVSSQRRWTVSEEDRRKAAESYERYLAIGGPYATQAAEALNRLEWAKK